MKAIHKAVGSYTLCGRVLRDTMIAGDVPTCKYCIAGGVGPHKKVVAILKESTPSEPLKARLVTFLKNQEDIPAEMKEVIARRFWDMIEPSTPSAEQESQDELWKQARHLIEIWDIDGLFKQFIITRKP